MKTKTLKCFIDVFMVQFVVEFLERNQLTRKKTMGCFGSECGWWSRQKLKRKKQTLSSGVMFLKQLIWVKTVGTNAGSSVKLSRGQSGGQSWVTVL